MASSYTEKRSPKESFPGKKEKIYVEFWWPLFLAIKFTFLFLKVPGGGGLGKTTFSLFKNVTIG